MALDKEFIEEIKKRLEEEQAQLKAELADFTLKTDKGTATVFPEYGDHSGENASEVASYDNNLSVKNTLEKTLRDITAALKRIKKGTYGVCKYCGNEIEAGRLKIRPTSSACINCKSKFTG